MSPLPDNAQRVRAGVYRADGYLWIRAYVTCPDGKRRMVGPRLAEQQGVGAEFEALAEVELAKRKAAMREGRVLAARKREPTVAEFVEQPLGLMLDLVRDYSREGDVVCDPTAGHGTALVAAKKLGRVPLGSEARRCAFEVARRRLGESCAGEGLPLFEVSA